MRARHLFALLLLVPSLATTASAGPQPSVSKAAGHEFSLTGSILLIDVEADSARYNLL